VISADELASATLWVEPAAGTLWQWTFILDNIYIVKT
jgi:hypothetical protein